MTEQGTVEIVIKKDPDNVRYRDYYVEHKLSYVPNKIYTFPLGDISNEKLVSDIGPIGAALVSMLNKIDALDFVYLTHFSVGLSKKRGRDWKAIEDLLFLDIQIALGATSYRAKNW